MGKCAEELENPFKLAGVQFTAGGSEERASAWWASETNWWARVEKRGDDKGRWRWGSTDGG